MKIVVVITLMNRYDACLNPDLIVFVLRYLFIENVIDIPKMNKKQGWIKSDK